MPRGETICIEAGFRLIKKCSAESYAMSTDADIDPRFAPAVVHRILLVDDEPDTAAFVKALLEKSGYEVHIARDGGQAHSMMVMKQPDFVILDLILPGESGFEVCERIKSTEAHIPVLVLSAIDRDDSRALAQRVGADAYMKPFNPDELLAQIKITAEESWARSRGIASASAPEKPARFSCKCGKRFKVNPQHRGKTMSCPNCGQPVHIPRHD
jgi:two-component system, OmpR family, response regulator